MKKKITNQLKEESKDKYILDSNVVLNKESKEKSILDSNVKSFIDLEKELTAKTMVSEGMEENMEGTTKDDNQTNPFEKWGLYSVCSYLEEAGRDNEIWDIIDDNESIMEIPYNERIKHRILVGSDLACRLLDVSNERNENDEDYYQMYELSMWGSVWDFSKFGFDNLIKKYPKAVEELNNTPADLGLFLHGFMNEYINHYYPYSKIRNHYIS